jgi:hypothetical protein
MGASFFVRRGRERVAASPAKSWSQAPDTARRSYLLSAKNVGFAGDAADTWPIYGSPPSCFISGWNLRR